jgi:hypothetical protein
LAWTLQAIASSASASWASRSAALPYSRAACAAEITEKHAGVRREPGVDLEQPAGLAEALAAASQKRVHVPVQGEDFAENLSRGDLCVHLGKVAGRAIYLLDGVIGRVGGGRPRGNARGVVWGAIGLRFMGGRLCHLLTQAAVEQFIAFGQLVVAAFPAADHPDQSVGRGDGLAGDTTELACRLWHVPAERPAPLAQRLAFNSAQGMDLRVAWHIKVHGPCYRACTRAPRCHYRTTARYR